MIKAVAFDLGGVIITIDQSQAISRFKEIGATNVEEWLDPYTQTGIFGDLEHGLISAEDFRKELRSLLAQYGIDFSLLVNFRGAPVHGYAARKEDGSIQMVLTLRGSFADIFWFSLSTIISLEESRGSTGLCAMSSSGRSY